MAVFNPFAGAKWIRCRESHEPDSFFCFKTSFRSFTEKASLFISVDSDFIVYIDGRETVRGQFPDYRYEKTYTEQSVCLSEGEHALCISMYYSGCNRSTGLAGIGALICSVISENGHLLAASSEEWKCRRDIAYVSGVKHHVSGQLGYVMTYDAENDDSWTAADYTGDRQWNYAAERIPEKDEPEITLSARPLPPLKSKTSCPYLPIKSGWISRTSEQATYAETVYKNDSYDFQSLDAVFDSESDHVLNLRPMPDSRNGVCVISDMGAEFAGFIELKLYAGAGTMIDISYGEHLADGFVRAYIGGRNFTDRYICREGYNYFRFLFRRSAGRYIQLNVTNIRESYLKILYFGLYEASAHLPAEAKFMTDRDEQSSALRKAAVRTLDLCMHDHYEDCPWREQSLYAYDSRNQMIFGYYIWGNWKFARASLDLLGRGYADSGLLNICAPNDSSSLKIIMFSYVWISAVREYTLFSGDFSLFAKFKNQIHIMLEKAMSRREENSGLFREDSSPKAWDFIEWVPGLEGDICGGKRRFLSAPFNAYLQEAMDSFADMLTMTQDTDFSAGDVRIESEKLKRRIHQKFFDEREMNYYSFQNEDGTFDSLKHLHTQYLMLAMNVTPDSLKKQVFESVLKHAGDPFTFSPLLYMMRAVKDISPESREFALKHIDSKFRKMLDNGATTFWEVEEGQSAFGNAGSLCHAWSSIHAWFYGAMTLGIRPVEPGFRRFEVCIYPGEFLNAEGEVPTPHGMIHVSWNRETDHSLSLKLTHPEGTEAVFKHYPEAVYSKITDNGVCITEGKKR